MLRETEGLSSTTLHRPKRVREAGSAADTEDSFQSEIKGGREDPRTNYLGHNRRPTTGPTPWVNPLVVVAKSEGDISHTVDCSARYKRL